MRKLTALCLDTTGDLSIRSTALRNVVVSLPRPGTPPLGNQIGPTTQGSANTVVTVLIPMLYSILDPTKVSTDAVDILVDTLRSFGSILQPKDIEQLQVHVMRVLENDRSTNVVKKRSVTALSLLAVYSPDILLSSFISHLIETLTGVHQVPQRTKLLVAVTSALASGVPQRFAPYLASICPLILSIVSSRKADFESEGYEPDSEEDEVKEAALIALENFQSHCPTEMRKFTGDLVNAGLTYIKYDPNFAGEGDDDDEDMGGTQDDEDDEDELEDDDEFEEDANFSDEDDFSWKVRRCAAKLTSTVINTRARDLLEDGSLYNKIAPVLIDRFKEREESVRLEILGTTTTLIRRTGELASTAMYSAPANKKRRRTSEENEAVTAAAENAPQRSLAKQVPKLIKAVAKLLKTKTTTLSTRQSAITLLTALVNALHGGLTEVLGQIIDPIVDLAQGGNTFTGASAGISMPTAVSISTVSATGGSLRIEVLRLIGKIAHEHSLDDVRPYLNGIVGALKKAITERYYKISAEALETATEVIKLLTQKDGKHTDEESAHVQGLYDAIVEKIKAQDTDLEVREKAVTALGVLLSRTGINNAGLVSLKAAQRDEGFDIVLQRLRNETTRIVSVRAIDIIVKGLEPDSSLSEDWVKAVVIELGGQLRKSNRVLRSVSLEALKAIAENPVSRAHLDVNARNDILRVVLPLITTDEILLLGPALVIARFALEAGDIPVDDTIVSAVCKLVSTQLGTGAVVSHLVALVQAIGELDGPQGVAGKKALMNALLQKVGVNGDTPAVAKAIAQLLVSGGNVFDVKVEDFCSEVKTAKESKRQCLALLVLGEAGLRLKSDFSVGPEIFLEQFKNSSDEVPVAAAVALGLAAVGNLQGYLPIIMQKLNGDDRDKYLLLHTLKEVCDKI